MPETADLILETPDATAELARRLAPLLKAGDVVLLSGPIGAGKTHFARALIQDRLSRGGRAEDVPSPTFTLVQTYDDGLCELWHSDLYRLSSSDEIVELGLEDAFDTAIVLVEWPDRLGSSAPDRACAIGFELLETGRRARIAWTDTRLETWLSQFHEHA